MDAGVKNHLCFVRYWVSDKAATKEELDEATAMTALGVVDVDFGSRYSEASGYLWTDDDFKIGGHDLNDELFLNSGKWLRLEIDIKD